MSIALAIFAKNPQVSPVKTRLAQDLGRDKAIRVYRTLLAYTQRTVKQWQDMATIEVKPYWALADQASCQDPQWQTFATIWTGEGGLGQRLHHIYSTLLAQHDAVILIGSDCPEIELSCFEAAVTKLKDHPVVIGPSHDGGFYLFASDRVIDSSIWFETQYSCNDTLKQLSTLLSDEALVPEYLTYKSDLDTLDDYQQQLKRSSMFHALEND